jgi:hypothetical protein
MICSSRWWARSVERELVPWGLKGVNLGDDVLEIGPGFGATSRVLARGRHARTGGSGVADGAARRRGIRRAASEPGNALVQTLVQVLCT